MGSTNSTGGPYCYKLRYTTRCTENKAWNDIVLNRMLAKCLPNLCTCSKSEMCQITHAAKFVSPTTIHTRMTTTPRTYQTTVRTICKPTPRRTTACKRTTRRTTTCKPIPRLMTHFQPTTCKRAAYQRCTHKSAPVYRTRATFTRHSKKCKSCIVTLDGHNQVSTYAMKSRFIVPTTRPRAFTSNYKTATAQSTTVVELPIATPTFEKKLEPSTYGFLSKAGAKWTIDYTRDTVTVQMTSHVCRRSTDLASEITAPFNNKLMSTTEQKHASTSTAVPKLFSIMNLPSPPPPPMISTEYPPFYY
ncbi:uncharacterized protein LOC126844517 isoform X2 [Adelges cooleyi]|nr:uncharacterized protein LOC126844517 isoform X2 [Adelges cooleyi]XP_050438729.1 uncharacterized protein LOC126844517 isoform X2 [Adelges cooleyi]